jgi:phosphoglycolate phosphatase-like HAD superfamily hydrolase
MHKIVALDFAGTLIRAEVIEDANTFRSRILMRSAPTRKDHADPESLYKANRQFTSRMTGLKEEHDIVYRKNDGGFMTIKGRDYLNQLSTNLFQMGMWSQAKEHGLDIIPKGLIAQLQRIGMLGYTLAIFSGVRTDIISGMLQIADVPIVFDYIYGQPPILGISNEDNLEAIAKHGKIAYVIGDKASDLEAGKKAGAETIFVTWGHAATGEAADHTIKSPKELSAIIR